MPPDISSRDAILDAAERLFARQGFTTTTIKEIGAEAEVNSALLYYYFADKETLYRETLRRLLGTLASSASHGLDVATSAPEGIRGTVRAQVEFTLARPHAPMLMVREMIDHEARHAEEQIAQHLAGTFRRLCDLIERGQRDGVFRADVDPQFAAISSLAQVVYLQVARPAVSILLGHGASGMTPEMVRAFGDHAAGFALAALAAARPPDEAGPARGRAATQRPKPRRPKRKGKS